MCNVFCCSVQLPIYVKPQITCGANVAQVNIMVQGDPAACIPLPLQHAALRVKACVFYVIWLTVLQVGPKQQLASSPAHVGGSLSAAAGGAGALKERKMAEDVVVTIHVKTPLMTNTLHPSHGALRTEAAA
jgi:hypothetical protein